MDVPITLHHRLEMPPPILGDVHCAKLLISRLPRTTVHALKELLLTVTLDAPLEQLMHALPATLPIRWLNQQNALLNQEEHILLSSQSSA